MSNPCHHGTCKQEENKYACTCHVGYEGNDCSQDIDECSPKPCKNNSTCYDGVNKFTCICAGGFTGAKCEQGIEDVTTEVTPRYYYKITKIFCLVTDYKEAMWQWSNGSLPLTSLNVRFDYDDRISCEIKPFHYPGKKCFTAYLHIESPKSTDSGVYKLLVSWKDGILKRKEYKIDVKIS